MLLLLLELSSRDRLVGPERKALLVVGLREDQPQSVQGRARARPIQELSRAYIYLGRLLAFLWLLGLKDLPGGRSWHLLAFEWGGHIQRDFGYSIFHRVLDSEASEDTASSFRGQGGVPYLEYMMDRSGFDVFTA